MVEPPLANEQVEGAFGVSALQPKLVQVGLAKEVVTILAVYS